MKGDDNNNITDEEWEELGMRDVAKKIHVCLREGALNDHKISYLFQGLTRSSSIETMHLYRNDLSVAAVRCMVPFLQNANNLHSLNLHGNNLQSEGFNLLLRALNDSPIKRLNVKRCSIESIEIDIEQTPRHLEFLDLSGNDINSDGCREVAKLLQGGDATLRELDLKDNKIDDEGVEILVDALQKNLSLGGLSLRGNDGISKQGEIMLLKLVIDISSIEATLQSNHYLTSVRFSFDLDNQIQELVDTVFIYTNHQCYTGGRREVNTGKAGRQKMIEFQLNSVKRAELAELQGVNHSVYSEIDPLHLPEVLRLVGRHHGQGELYVALKSSIAELISTVNRKECLKQQRVRYKAMMDRHRAIIADYGMKVEAIEAEIAAIEDEEGVNEEEIGSESRSNKRRRV